MKILFVIAHIGKGGGQVTQSIRIIRELSKNNETKLLTLRYDSDIVDEPCETEYAGDLIYPWGILDLWKAVRRHKDYDVVQCFDNFYSLTSVWLAGVKNFYIRLGLSAKGEFKGRGYKYLYHFADLILFPVLFSSGFVVNSKELQKEMPYYKSIYIPNGYDLNGYQKSNKKQLRKQLNLPQNKFLLLYTGKIIKRKNLDVLFRALRKLDNANLILVGNTNEDRYGDTYYNKLVSEYKDVMQKVIVIGEVHMEKVNDYLNASDVFVFPSSLEGSPNSVLEAMTTGLPVICSDIPNHREIINHGKNGFMFKTHKDLIQIISKFQNNEINSGKITSFARNYIKKNHDIRKIAEKYLDMYGAKK